jgi:nitroreductase
MNPRLDLIFSRRSIRAYERRPVPDDLVRDILDAAMAAPSAVCKDPWRFVIVRERETMRRLSDALPNGKMLAEAGVGIIVCGELAAAHDGQLSYLLQDTSAAIQNALLAASALGLGAVWLGVHPREDRIAHVRALLGLPAGVVPVCIVAVGWPAERKPPRTRYAEDKVHRERW